MTNKLFLLLMGCSFSLAINAQKAEMTEPEITKSKTVETEMTATELEATAAEPAMDIVPEQVENSLMLHYPTLSYSTNEFNNKAFSMSGSSYNGNEAYRQDKSWRHARNLRKGGIWLTCLSYVAIIPLSFAFVEKDALPVSNGNPYYDVVAAATNTTFTIACIAKASAICMIPMAGGIAMWAIGNHNMKKIRLSYQGNGLALNF